MRLEVRHLEVLLAIEESGSISGAARTLGVDQPHVTRQLRRIEQRLDVAVYVRTARGVTPTPEGRRVLALARRALGVLDELARPEDAGVRGGGALRVLYYGLPAIAILDDLGRLHPDLQVRFGSTTPQDAHEQLRAGTADVFLGIGLPHVPWPAAGPLVATEILADPTHVHLGADHPRARDRELRLADLAGESWITGVDPESATMVTEECRLVGGFRPLLTHRAGDETTVSALLAHGRGVALGSSVAAARPGVVGRPYRGSSPARWMQVYAPGRLDRELVATISSLLRRRHESWTRARAAPGDLPRLDPVQGSSAGDTTSGSSGGSSGGGAGHR